LKLIGSINTEVVSKQHKITEMLVSKTLDFNQNYL